MPHVEDRDRFCPTCKAQAFERGRTYATIHALNHPGPLGEDRDPRTVVGTAERTDALLEALTEIKGEREAADRWWQFGRRWQLDREIIAFTGELQRNERVRARRERREPPDEEGMGTEGRWYDL